VAGEYDLPFITIAGGSCVWQFNSPIDPYCTGVANTQMFMFVSGPAGGLYNFEIFINIVSSPYQSRAAYQSDTLTGDEIENCISWAGEDGRVQLDKQSENHGGSPDPCSGTLPDPIFMTPSW